MIDHCRPIHVAFHGQVGDNVKLVSLQPFQQPTYPLIERRRSQPRLPRRRRVPVKADFSCEILPPRLRDFGLPVTAPARHLDQLQIMEHLGGHPVIDRLPVVIRATVHNPLKNLNLPYRQTLPHSTIITRHERNKKSSPRIAGQG